MCEILSNKLFIEQTGVILETILVTVQWENPIFMLGLDIDKMDKNMIFLLIKSGDK